jgi:MoaA/NifB/PqqE/SkfB family radical SAM enzyme
MALGTTARTAARFALARATGRPCLLALGWAVTGRCNARCPFCARHSGPDGPSAAEALSIVDQLAEVGCRRVHFTGGEPLVRRDLAELLGRVRARGMTSSVNTNGMLLEERRDVVALADSFLVSVDGPEPVHDRYRGAGSFARMRRGLALLRAEAKPTVLSVTLSRDNLDELPFFEALALGLGVRVALQPGATHVLGATTPNPETPDVARFRAAMRALARDRRTRRWIWNSRRGLEVLAEFPEQHRLRTHAGRSSARLEADGRLFPCSRSVTDPSAHPAPNVHELGVREAFRRLSRIDCSGHVCQCAHNVEKNLLFEPSPEAWWTFVTERLGELRRMAG